MKINNFSLIKEWINHFGEAGGSESMLEFTKTNNPLMKLLVGEWKHLRKKVEVMRRFYPSIIFPWQIGVNKKGGIEYIFSSDNFEEISFLYSPKQMIKMIYNFDLKKFVEIRDYFILPSPPKATNFITMLKKNPQKFEYREFNDEKNKSTELKKETCKSGKWLAIPNFKNIGEAKHRGRLTHKVPTLAEMTWVVILIMETSNYFQDDYWLFGKFLETSTTIKGLKDLNHSGKISLGVKFTAHPQRKTEIQKALYHKDHRPPRARIIII